MNKKTAVINELNNSYVLIVKKLNFLNLIDMIFFERNNLLETFMDLNSVIFLKNKI